jgi:hypothetical protein
VKLSTKLHAVAAGLTTFGLAGAGIALLSNNIYAAGALALLGAAGQAIDASAHVIEKPGNGA